jgi:peptidoglycan/xylan/chitin deacetylase (PgdA/CDA1 family)
MTMQVRIKSTLLALDRLIAQCSLAMRNEQGVLLSFLFHGLFEDPEESRSGTVDPQQGITVEMFRRFIAHFQAESYTFVSVADISNGLPPGGKYVLVTFDDGYYNNVRALPVLESFGVPALLFPSSGHVKQGKAFWWDVAQREMLKRGRSVKEIHRLCGGLIRLKTADAEAQVLKWLGPVSFKPVSDLDRPFTPAELRDFSNHPLLSLGNHTSDHAVLTSYSAAEVRAQIQAAQDDIHDMTGKSPEIIAYPCGNESTEVRNVATSLGLRFGLGVAPGWNKLPIQPASRAAMKLKRFTLWGDRAIEPQCHLSRSEFSLYRMAHNVKRKAHHSLSMLRPA